MNNTLSKLEISPFKLPLSIGTKPYTNMDYPEYYDFLPGVFFDSLPVMRQPTQQTQSVTNPTNVGE